MTAAMSDCIHVPCPTCRAEVNEWCTYLFEGRVVKHKAPCVARMVLAATREAS